MIQTTDISLVGKYIQEQLLFKCIPSNLNHNHPPVQFLVKNCEYCKLYGNMFNIKH